MKKVLAIVLAVVLLAMGLGAGIASADGLVTQGELSSGGGDPPMPLDGTWVILDEIMTAPAFFTGPWTWTSDYAVKFTISDLYVVTDQFNVYDNNVLVTTTPAKPDWDVLGLADPFTSPPWTGDPNVALADGRFCSAVLYFAPGSHSITIEDIHIPPVSVGGAPFPDGTVAFKAEVQDLGVLKHYTYTDVCFEQDNDLDGEFNEDPIDTIDNDGDGLIDEDPVDCPEGTKLGTPLPMDAEGNYLLEAVLKKNGRVSSYNPGQYYAVSTVNVRVDVDELTIAENFCACADISALNPKKGGGSVVIVAIVDDVAYQILDAKSDEVSVDDCIARAVLEDVPAGATILMYVKFGPRMKGEEWGGPYECENWNLAWVVEAEEFGASASLKLILKETGD